MDAPVWVIDAFVDGQDIVGLGFDRGVPAATGRPPYDPLDLAACPPATVMSRRNDGMCRATSWRCRTAITYEGHLAVGVSSSAGALTSARY